VEAALARAGTSDASTIRPGGTCMAPAANVDPSATVAQIVAKHSETAAVFHRHHIDSCSDGDVTIPRACATRGKDPAALLAELERAVHERAAERAGEDLLSLSTPALLARIVDRHHDYLRRALPRIEPLLAKVAAVHGRRDAKLAGLRSTFVELLGLLVSHLAFEEETLFPELAASGHSQASAAGHLHAMVKEHLAVGAKLAQLRGLVDDFRVPAWGCNSYQALMAELEHLEADLLQHLHLEDHVLVPRFLGVGSPPS
jgi:regulator of cell morphogenesis and NO signaling